jgi:hypothetical protein
LKFGGFCPPKQEYTTRVSLPCTFLFFAFVRNFAPQNHRPVSFWVGFKIGENGFIEFWPPKNRGSPPPAPTLVAAPSRASRHTFSGRHTRPTLRRSQETINALTPPVIIASSCANSAFFHSFLEKRKRERESARDRERNKERAPASGDRARSAEETWIWEQNDDGVSRILIKYGERHWQWERNCRDKENTGGGLVWVGRVIS